MATIENVKAHLHGFLKIRQTTSDVEFKQLIEDPQITIIIKEMRQFNWFIAIFEKHFDSYQIQVASDPVADLAPTPATTEIDQQTIKNPSDGLASLSPQPLANLSMAASPESDPPKPSPISSPPKVTPMSAPLRPSSPLAFRLINGKAGVDYRCKLELITQNAPDFEIKSIEVPPQIGLHGDGELGEVLGLPEKAGDFQVKVIYLTSGSDVIQSASVALVINPDPKSLWKDLPSNQSDPYWKPDLASMTLMGDSVHMVAASKRGRSHAHTGGFRDDDFHLAYLHEDRWHIAIVSDGAGSAKFSRRGSQIICNEGGARLNKYLAGNDGKKLLLAVEALHTKRADGSTTEELELQIQNLLYTTVGYTAHSVTKLLQDECISRAELGGVFKDYSSTAIISVMRRFSSGVFCAAYWVGDGAIGIIKADGTITLLGEADSGEYSGQTRFIHPDEVTQKSLMKRIRFELTTDFQAMLLMTDGISDPFFETESNLTNPVKWLALWDDVSRKANLTQHDQAEGKRMEDWLDFWSAGNHDDRTFAAIY